MSSAVTLSVWTGPFGKNLELSPFVCMVSFCFRSFRLQVEEEENKRRSELYISTLLEDINSEESWYKVRLRTLKTLIWGEFLRVGRGS